jgi:hypothetical protein
LIIPGSGETTELRVALRGIARSDPDFYAAAVLAKVAQHRWEALVPDLNKRPTFVRSESHMLPGMFIIGASIPSQTVADTLASVKKTLEELSSTPVSPVEIDRARTEVLAELSSLLSKQDAQSDNWLDQDTYRITETRTPTDLVTSLTPADLQRLAARLFNNPAATVVLGDTQQLKSALQGRVPFEVVGESAPAIASPAKPPVATPKPAPSATPW